MAQCVNGHVDPPRYANGNCKLCQYDRNARLQKDPSNWSKRNRRAREQAIKAYGGKCACCGESWMDFLVIDHVEGDGAQHRKSIASSKSGDSWRKSAGYQTYKWLRLHSYPEGFQVLCANCNMAKERGGCPPNHRLS